jgi:hypothetical protein
MLGLAPVLSARLHREFGISHFEYLILARLSQAPGSMLRMSVPARLTGESLPRLSKAVGHLESLFGSHGVPARPTAAIQ